MRFVLRVECVMGWFGCPAVGVMKSHLSRLCSQIYSMQKESIWCSVAGYLCPGLAVKPETAGGSLELLYACWLVECIRGSGRWTSAEEWIQWIRANRAALKQLCANSVTTLFFLIFLNPCTLPIPLPHCRNLTLNILIEFLVSFCHLYNDFFLQLTHSLANIYQRPELVINTLAN